MKAVRDSRRSKNASVISYDAFDKQKEIAETKNDFLKEKAKERKTM